MASHGVARIVRARTEEQRLQDLQKIKTYRDLENQIRAQAELRIYDLALFQLTTKLLHLNPEYYTIWNVRRRCLISGLLSTRSGGSLPSKTSETRNQESDGNILQSELGFTVPLLLEFPKCYWIWNFRQWILSQVILRLPVPIARKVWETELGLASKMLTKDQRNFHAWGYRRYVVAKLESPELQGKSMAEDEFAYTTRLIGLDLSNFSAWHNRSQLILRVLDERGADHKMRAAFLDKELNTIHDALNVGPEDQSLWYYHQFLMSQIVDHGRQTIVPALTVDERAAYLRREIDNIKDLLEDYGNIKWIYEGLLECTLALERLEQPAERDGGEVSGSKTWLAKLRALDTLRAGRWNDVERHTEL